MNVIELISYLSSLVAGCPSLATCMVVVNGSDKAYILNESHLETKAVELKNGALCGLPKGYEGQDDNTLIIG